MEMDKELVPSPEKKSGSLLPVDNSGFGGSAGGTLKVDIDAVTKKIHGEISGNAPVHYMTKNELTDRLDAREKFVELAKSEMLHEGFKSVVSGGADVVTAAINLVSGTVQTAGNLAIAGTQAVDHLGTSALQLADHVGTASVQALGDMGVAGIKALDNQAQRLHESSMQKRQLQDQRDSRKHELDMQKESNNHIEVLVDKSFDFERDKMKAIQENYESFKKTYDDKLKQLQEELKEAKIQQEKYIGVDCERYITCTKEIDSLEKKMKALEAEYSKKESDFNNAIRNLSLQNAIGNSTSINGLLGN